MSRWEVMEAMAVCISSVSAAWAAREAAWWDCFWERISRSRRLRFWSSVVYKCQHGFVVAQCVCGGCFWVDLGRYLAVRRR